MHLRFLSIATLLAISASSSVCLAEHTHGADQTEAKLAQKTTLSSLVRLALARSPAMRAARQRERALTARSKAAGRLPDPELEMQVWQVPVKRPYAVNDAGMIMLGVKQMIPAPGSLGAREAAEGERARIVQAEREQVARKLRADVGHAFADYLEVSLLHHVHHEHIAVGERITQVTRARQAAGGAFTDVTQADVELARAHADEAGEDAKIRAIKARINALLARPADAPLGEPEVTNARAVKMSLDAIVSRALERRPDLAIQHARLASERAELRASEKEASLPSFSVGALYFPPTRGMSEHGYGASFSMSLPWVWGSGRDRRSAQRASAESVESEIEQVRLDVSADVSAALANMDGAVGRLRVLSNDTLPASRRNVELALAGFDTGGVGLTTLLVAKRDVIDTQMQIVEARSMLEHALVDLDYAAGEELPKKALMLEPSTTQTGAKP